jgi:hypothetical protein
VIAIIITIMVLSSGRRAALLERPAAFAAPLVELRPSFVYPGLLEQPPLVSGRQRVSRTVLWAILPPVLAFPDSVCHRMAGRLAWCLPVALMEQS